MKAEALAHERHVLAEDAFAEIAVWRVSRPVKGSKHRFKYRLALIVGGECVLRYDNETGKGDHRHVGTTEAAYAFSSYEKPHRLLGRRRDMETATMKTVTLEVASRDDVTRRALEAFKGKKQRARISFATPELLWKVLTAKRWELLKAMAGQGPLSIREVARRVDRDVKAVHGDVHALIDAGLVDKTTNGHVVFPFGAIRVAFTLRAA